MYRITRAPRSHVYNLIDGERAYQARKWNKNTTVSKNEHSVEEWIMYIEDYLAEAKHALSRVTRADADTIAMDIMRKVAAMAVAAMEEHETPTRELPN